MVASAYGVSLTSLLSHRVRDISFNLASGLSLCCFFGITRTWVTSGHHFLKHFARAFVRANTYTYRDIPGGGGDDDKPAMSKGEFCSRLRRVRWVPAAVTPTHAGLPWINRETASEVVRASSTVCKQCVRACVRACVRTVRVAALACCTREKLRLVL